MEFLTFRKPLFQIKIGDDNGDAPFPPLKDQVPEYKKPYRDFGKLLVRLIAQFHRILTFHHNEDQILIKRSATVQFRREPILDIGFPAYITPGRIEPLGAPRRDLFIGDPDATGREIYLRQNNQNEVRSGENRLSSYTGGSRTSWYNLRLFPDSPGRTLSLDMVQEVRVDFPAPGADAEPAAPMVLVRNAGGWTLEGNSESPDTQRVETYIRSILDAEGEDFAVSVKPEEPVFNDGRITLNIGDGSAHTIRLGPPGEENRRNAAVSFSPYVYTLGEWTVNRLFRESASFVTR